MVACPAASWTCLSSYALFLSFPPPLPSQTLRDQRACQLLIAWQVLILACETLVLSSASRWRCVSCRSPNMTVISERIMSLKKVCFLKCLGAFRGNHVTFGLLWRRESDILVPVWLSQGHRRCGPIRAQCLCGVCVCESECAELSVVLKHTAQQLRINH